MDLEHALLNYLAKQTRAETPGHSRGMDHAILVEKDRAAQQVILENIKMTKESEKFQLLKMSAERVLSNLSETFDLVLLDPPYAKEQIVENLELLQEKKRLTENVIVVCETDKEVELPDQIGKLELTRQKTYGISKISIYEF